MHTSKWPKVVRISRVHFKCPCTASELGQSFAQRCDINALHMHTSYPIFLLLLFLHHHLVVSRHTGGTRGRRRLFVDWNVCVCKQKMQMPTPFCSRTAPQLYARGLQATSSSAATQTPSYITIGLHVQLFEVPPFVVRREAAPSHVDVNEPC